MKRNEDSVGIELPELLEVVVKTSPHRTELLVVTLCRFVVADTADGHSTAAIEIVYDSKVRSPTRSYFCPLRRLKHLVVRLGDLQSIRPYVR